MSLNLEKNSKKNLDLSSTRGGGLRHCGGATAMEAPKQGLSDAGWTGWDCQKCVRTWDESSLRRKGSAMIESGLQETGVCARILSGLRFAMALGMQR